jgi:hypothetical protein
MEPINKRTKKRAKRQSPKNSRQHQLHKRYQQEVVYGPGTNEEELVDYEPEEPATFSPMEYDISVVGEDLSPPGDGQNNISSTINDFPANLAEGGVSSRPSYMPVVHLDSYISRM